MKRINSKIINLKYGKGCKIIKPVNIYGSKFGNNVFVGPFVEIQNNTLIGDGVMFTNDDLKKGKITRNSKFFKKTKIGNDVVIGSNSTLLPVTITSGTVIGAGSTVTKNIKVKGIYAGSPAKLLRKI